MSQSQDKIIELVKAERRFQDAAWNEDDENNRSHHDWVTFIVKYLGRASNYPFVSTNFRISMVKIAALAIAAVEWDMRKQEE